MSGTKCVNWSCDAVLDNNNEERDLFGTPFPPPGDEVEDDRAGADIVVGPFMVSIYFWRGEAVAVPVSFPLDYTIRPYWFRVVCHDEDGQTN